jgi:hypothetical protein
MCFAVGLEACRKARSVSQTIPDGLLAAAYAQWPLSAASFSSLTDELSLVFCSIYQQQTIS